MNSTIFKRSYRRWAQPGISDSVMAARLLFVPDQLAIKTMDKVSTKSKSPSHSTGYTLSDILHQLRLFLTKKPINPLGQSIVLAGTCNLAKEMTNGYRGILSLPTPIQLDERILVFTGPDQRELALKCGADIAGGDELIADVQEGKLQFDRVLATTDQLGVVTKLARILGPRGLMPSVKTGTLTTDLVTALKQLRSTVPFRLEKVTGIFNIPIAKTTMTDKEVEENVKAALEYILSVGESSSVVAGGKKKKAVFIKQVHVVSHHGFSVQLAPLEYTIL